MHINCCVYIAHWGSKVKARGWKARRLGGEKPEIRGRKSELRGQRSEIGGQSFSEKQEARKFTCLGRTGSQI